MPRRKYRPSKLVLRLREQLNVMLARNNLPKHVYKDYTQNRVQFYLGSSTGVGYARLRRTFRAHSSYGRWCPPTPTAVPFAHPFSRRQLNAKRFQKQNYDAILPVTKRGVVNLLGNRAEIRIPPRLVPWRNFNYRRPRRGALPTLQR